MTVRGIEAIKLYMPMSKADAAAAIKTNIPEETGRTIEPVVPVDGGNNNGNTMNSVERYRQEWTQLLANLDENPEMLRAAAFSGKLKMSKFRSIHWALLLRVLNADYRSWPGQRQQQRSRYEKFRVDYVSNPHELAVRENDDPLSQSTQSVWNQYFSDQELFALIRQDVVRTFPAVDFFRKALIQNAMTNILFYYAREHPYMCYRQGMHEILAPIIFVLYSDHQSLLHFSEIAKTEINETLLDVLNTAYLEADTYSIFSRLMASVESYYRVSRFASTPGGDLETQRVNESPNADAELQSEAEVISQLNFIRDRILAKQDQHLHHYLLKMEIPLHIFGIRWLRLLFGREFMLIDLLVLWDAIFADSDRFDLPNYILVAMLVHIRDKLLLSDYTSSLTYLMRYPSNVDVNLVLRHALHMLNPKQFDYPVNAFSCVSFADNLAAAAASAAAASAAIAPTPFKSQRVHTNSESSTGASGSHINRQITYMQARNAESLSALAKLQDTNRMAMDGHLADSPELLRLELKNAHTVIKIARSKLLNYLSTVRRHMDKQQGNEELNRTLDGIEELCSFLDVKFIFPMHARTTPIDEALEANERKQSAVKPTNNPTMSNSQQMPGLPSASGGGSGFGGGYEMPENAFMHNSTARLLGDRREIELSTITSDERPEIMVLQNGLPAAEPQQRPQQ
ncbi:TBC1 domain family member 5 [Drosophila grimshawi]|uniref:GH19149 n=1 Tax=Drosophila grimshawi TaxID=7222 RepID=B4JEM4_DROGR|nr:TBC1 domain family member 5 [Drosophila grimshawi]EDV93155.1 GH19149 [Drosophila grimshawi]